MAADKKQKEEEIEVQTQESEGVRVTNNATCPLKINDVKLKVGASAYFNDFDPENAKYKAWIKAKMISVNKSQPL